MIHMIEVACNQCGKKFMTRKSHGRRCCNSVCAMIRRHKAGVRNKQAKKVKPEPVIKTVLDKENGVKVVRVDPGVGYMDW